MKQLKCIFKLALLFTTLALSQESWAQKSLKIGSNVTMVDSSAQLEVESTTKAFLPPRMTTVQRNAIVRPATGLVLFNITFNCLQINMGTPTAPTWQCASGINPSTGGTAEASSIGGLPCSANMINGALTAGIAVSGVTMTLHVNVTQVGTWNITSGPTNGVTFSGSGIFTGTGCQAITLTATGTPTALGSTTWNTNTIPAGSATATVAAGGSITSIACAGATTFGTLSANSAASGVSSTISYTGGNSGPHGGQIVTSTGVTGLTAMLTAGSFVLGNGFVTYNITGTPANGGTASFAINIGGLACTLTRTVTQPSSGGTAVFGGTPDCNTSMTGTMTANTTISPGSVSQTITVDVTTPGTYNISTAPVNGVTFSGSGSLLLPGTRTIELTATGMPASAAASPYIYTINTTPSCTFSRTVATNPTSGGSAVVSGYSCTASAGTMTAGTAVTGVTQTIIATVETKGSYNITATANGVTFAGSGNFLGTGSQNIVLTATGTPTVSGLHSYTINTTPSCTFSRTVVTNPTSGGSAVVSGYTCNTASAGTMTASAEVSGVTQTITATVQTMGSYNITATANGVTFSGSGNFLGTSSQNIVLTASGTPTVSGVHSYTINTTPSCTFSRTVNPAALPANITLSPIGPHVVASVFDNDYLPYTAPTGVATFETSVAAGGGIEPVVDLQGILTTTGVSIRIPYTVTVAAVTLPLYSQTMTIPEASTEDGISRDVSFSYSGTTLGVGTGTITATLRAIGGTLNVKKLDIQTGVGSDNLGVLLAQFSYATNNLGGTANFQFRAMAGIPDRKIASSSYRMFYLPVTNPITNKTWLNNNLGADYSNTAKPQFSPASQAASSTDRHAYGSFFQWGRSSDGHELINWTSSTAGTPVNNAFGALSGVDNPPHGSFITTLVSSTADWRTPQNDNLWQGASGINNPCPIGYRLPNFTELNAERISWAPNNNTAGALASPLKLTNAGGRGNDGVFNSYVSTRGYYWSSTVSGMEASALEFNASSALLFNDSRGKAFPVRCIRD
jgi:hypothetical protein